MSNFGGSEQIRNSKKSNGSKSINLKTDLDDIHTVRNIDKDPYNNSNDGSVIYNPAQQNTMTFRNDESDGFSKNTADQFDSY